ncbi:hypothetical protein D3C80_2172660 [compost metagenome]
MHSEGHLIRVGDVLAEGVVQLFDQLGEIFFLAVTRVAQAVIGNAIQFWCFTHS